MRNRKIIISFLLFFFVLLISNICFAGDLDYIHDYTITVDPRTDGSLTMSYYLEWEVLDSTSEGPLTWIKIGIPNANIAAFTSSIVIHFFVEITSIFLLLVFFLSIFFS